MGRFPALYLHVLARDDPRAAAQVLTAWPTAAVDDYEEILWLRGMRS